jgi:SAM-dependent methyltransferase
MVDIPVTKQYDSEGTSVYGQQFDDSDYYLKYLVPTVQRAWQIPKTTSPKLLDIGCGTGIMTRALKQHFGGTALGVDISEPMVQAAAALEAKTKQDIQYCAGDCMQDIRKLPLVAALAPFDLVNASWLWTNASTYAELKAMASNAYNLLRKDGQLCGLLQNPFLHRKDYLLFERYRMIYSPEGTEDQLKDGQFLGVMTVFDAKLPPLNLSDHFWTAPTIEKAVREAGFTEFHFASPPYIFKADNEYEAAFYKPLIDKPDFIIFTPNK